VADTIVAMPAEPRLKPGALGPGLVAVAVVAAGCALVGYEARHLTFYLDDWSFVLGRRGLSAGVFLRPHVEHLSALPILAYKLLLAVFGARSYAPFMVLLLLVHAVVCLLLYVLARRRVGPWVALAPVAILALLGPAWQDLLWAFQVGYLGSVAAGLGMILCLERRDRPGDVGAAVLLIVSLACSSIGLGFVVLAAVLLALEQPRAWPRFWVVAIALVLYGLWYVAYGVSDAHSSNISRIPGYLVKALSAAVASVTGLGQTHVSQYLVSTSYGGLIAGAALILVVVHLLRGGRIPALAWAVLAAAVALWTAQCLSGLLGGAAREANESRYQYVAAVFVLLAVVSIAQGWRPGRYGAVALAIVVALVVVANVSMLDQRANVWRGNTAYTAAATGVLQVTRNVVAPNFYPEDFLTAGEIGNASLVDVLSAGPYFSAVRAFGSAADTPGAILRRPEKVREAADLILFHAERLSLRPLTAPTSATGRCRTARSGSALGAIAAGPGAVALKLAPGPSAELQLRRFASDYRFVGLGLSGGESVALNFPRDGSSLLWHLRLLGGARLRLCAPGT
jgi:hypothetical protein